MTKKTALRFLKRNEVKRLKHVASIITLPPSFFRRWREATRIYLRS